MEFSDLIYVGLVSGLISSFITIFAITQMVNGFVESTRDRLTELLKDDTDLVDCYLVFNDKMMYMYNKDNNEFIAQGSTWEELNSNTSSRHKNVMFNLPTSEIDKAKEFKK